MSSSSNNPKLRRARNFRSSANLSNNTRTSEHPSPTIHPSTNARLSTSAPRIPSGTALPPPTAPRRTFRTRSQSQTNLNHVPPRTPPIPSYAQPTASTQRSARRPASTAQLTASSARQRLTTIEQLLSRPPTSMTEALQELRTMVLHNKLIADAEGNSPLRIYVWSILLGVPPMAAEDYFALIHRGASTSYAKIRNDTFRTLATDPLFRRRVSEASLIRLLNAFQWRMRDQGLDAQYVQGMNVIAAPFLYAANSEMQAFALFEVFIQRECPAYVRPTMEGVHRGLELVDRVLDTVDPKLFGHLKSKNLAAELYAFPSVLTLSACTPPLPEVLKLWDFLLAYGAHLNILCVVAQLLLMREDLLQAQSPMKLLRQFPPLEARAVIGVAVGLVRRIPVELFDAVVEHAK